MLAAFWLHELFGWLVLAHTCNREQFKLTFQSSHINVGQGLQVGMASYVTRDQTVEMSVIGTT